MTPSSISALNLDKSVTFTASLFQALHELLTRLRWKRYLMDCVSIMPASLLSAPHMGLKSAAKS